VKEKANVPGSRSPKSAAFGISWLAHGRALTDINFARRAQVPPVCSVSSVRSR